MPEGTPQIPSAQEIADARANALLDSERKQRKLDELKKLGENLPELPPEEVERRKHEAFDISEDVNRKDDERTPKEWREKLRGLIASAKEKLGMSEGGERAKAYLAGRSGALTEKAKGLGPIPEKAIRWLGERYNKLDRKYQLAIGVALIAGVGFSAAGSIPALIAGYGLVAQRGAGMAGKYVKFEKHLRETSEGKASGYWAKKEWYKKLAEKPEWQRKAMAGVMAAGYTGLMSFGIHEAIGVIRGDESWGGQLHEWVKSHWPLGGSAGVHPDAISSSTESLSTEGHGAGSAAPESSTPETAPEAADADQGSATAPETAPEATNAGAESVAGEPTHDAEVPQSPETEIHQPETAPTTDADAESDVTTADAGEGNVAAQTDLSAQEWRAEYAEPTNHTGAPDWRAEHTESDFAPEAQAETPAPAETAHQAPLTERRVFSTPNAVPTDTPGAFYDVQPQPPIEDHATTASPQPEAGHAPAPEANHLVVNTHGVEVTTSEPHIYADEGGEHLLIYGGSPAERAQLIGQYFQNPEHAHDVVYGADDTNMTYRIPWQLVNGETVPGEPVKTSGFLSFFKSFMSPPEPDELRRLIQ